MAAKSPAKGGSGAGREAGEVTVDVGAASSSAADSKDGPGYTRLGDATYGRGKSLIAMMNQSSSVRPSRVSKSATASGGDGQGGGEAAVAPTRSEESKGRARLTRGRSIIETMQQQEQRKKQRSTTSEPLSVVAGSQAADGAQAEGTAEEQLQSALDSLMKSGFAADSPAVLAVKGQLEASRQGQDKLHGTIVLPAPSEGSAPADESRASRTLQLSGSDEQGRSASQRFSIVKTDSCSAAGAASAAVGASEAGQAGGDSERLLADGGEALAEEEEEEAEGFEGFTQEELTLTREDYVHIGLAMVLPGALAVSPVLMPFGNPFAQEGDNSIGTNWAYYFWYTPIGWAAMWIKIVLWNSELWDTDFFMPFMHSRPGFFSCNSTIVAVLNSTLFATFFYCCGYLIFHNPVPIGTIAFGVPCFVVLFINMYFFVVPSTYRQTWRDHFRIFRCWFPFVLWVMALVVYMSLVWVQSYLVLGIENKYLFVLGNIVTQLAFVIIRELFASMPLEWFMGDQHMDLSMLWNLGYSAMCSTMSDWIFPGIPTDAAGLTSTGGVIAMNFALGWYQFRSSEDVSSVLVAFLNSICDVVSGWAFLFIFIYNAFGPNQHVIYMISDFSARQKWEAVAMVGFNFGINVVKLIMMYRVARDSYDAQMKQALTVFGITALRRWYWLVTWLLVSTCCACGACMVMMHDGMDFSFSFKQWHGTWPFVSHQHHAQ